MIENAIRMLLTHINRMLIISVMDWKTLISKIVDSGLTQEQIGLAIGKGQSWVSSVHSGRITSVRWEDGQALIQLLESSSSQKKAA